MWFVAQLQGICGTTCGHVGLKTSGIEYAILAGVHEALRARQARRYAASSVRAGAVLHVQLIRPSEERLRAIGASSGSQSRACAVRIFGVR